MHTQSPPNILEVLDGAPFPATLVELVAYAEDQDASEDALDLIQAMPDRIYRNMHDISAHIGQLEPLPSEENIWSSAPVPERESRNAEKKLRKWRQIGMQERLF